MIPQKVILDSFKNNKWIRLISPANFYIGQAVSKITTVIEVKGSGYDVFMNGRHHYYQDPTGTAVKGVDMWQSTPLQLSAGKVQLYTTPEIKLV